MGEAQPSVREEAGAAEVLGGELRAVEWNRPRVAQLVAEGAAQLVGNLVREALQLRGGGTEAPAAAAKVQGKQRAARLDWAGWLKRSFGLDVLACPGCGARRRVLAVHKGPGVKEV